MAFGPRRPIAVADLPQYVYELQNRIKDLSTTELGFIDGVTAGTATASKALVLDSSKGIATITSATITTLTTTTIASAFTASGAITPTAGVAAAGGFAVSPRNWHTGAAPA